MNRGFEFFVAVRYLTAKRKQAMISIITAISVLGVAGGVASLIIALAINTGFRNTLQRNLLGATGHVTVLEKEVSEGIGNWRELAPRFQKLPGVISVSPALFDTVIFSGARPTAGVLKGILPPDQAPLPTVLMKLKEGAVSDWKPAEDGRMPVILGSRLAQTLGVKTGGTMKVVTTQITAFGQRLDDFPFRVVGIFESGFYDVDNAWAFTSLDSLQRVLSLPDVVSAIEIQLADVFQAGAIARQAEQLAGPKLAATDWREQNKPLLTALEGEKAATMVVIGLILGMAALNILSSLIMMTMEKHRDIALLLSMGARSDQIRAIFVLQGILIGVAGVVLGVVGGYLVCWLGNRFRLIQLNEAIYSLSYVPFEPKALDAALICAGALLVSFVATIYPARSASRIAPAESLRYE